MRQSGKTRNQLNKESRLRCLQDPNRAYKYKSRHWKRQRERILTKFGRKCNNPTCRWINDDGTLGCTDCRCLQIDHVNGNGKKELHNVPQYLYYRTVLEDNTGKYQLLCANCNWIKRVVNKEVLQNRPTGCITPSGEK